MWYTRDPGWDGTFSTYSYNWTSGDRFGFAPVTVTQGAELLTGPDPTPSQNAGSLSLSPPSMVLFGGGGGPAGVALVVVVLQAVVMGVMVVVGLGGGFGV